MDIKQAKVAWLVPSASSGGHYGPVLAETASRFKESIFYTGSAWPNYEKLTFDNAQIKVVGKTEVVNLKQNEGYGQNLIVASPAIVPELIKYRPNIIIANGFSIWTLLSLLLKPFFRWKVVVIFDGISPSTTFEDDKLRLLIRRWMCKSIEAFVTNTKAASQYCADVLGIERDRILYKTYIVPDAGALNASDKPLALDAQGVKFLYVGQLVSRKGVKKLVEACTLLKAKGLQDFTLILVGDGEERQALEDLIAKAGIEDRVIFTGWLDYDEIGKYFQAADVFVLPSFEDTWGAVVLEAMAFGKPVACSTLAGASEVIQEGVNGVTFNPHNAEELAEKLAPFIQSETLVEQMSVASKETVTKHYASDDVSHFFADLSRRLLS